jgi:peptide/nickel transport system substrate-binding protein
MPGHRTTKRTWRARRAWLAVLVALALVAAGCGGDDDDTSGGDETEDGEPQTGGTLTTMTGYSTKSFDPIELTSPANTGGDGPAAFLVYGALLKHDFINGVINPGLAESLESDDGVTWTLKLREDLTFTDDTPLDAEAVRFNWQRAADPASKSPGAAVSKQITRYNVVDDQTLEVTLAAKNNRFNWSAAQYLGLIASPTAIQAKGAQYGSAPVGAGPFTVSEFVRDDHITYEKNPDYYEAPKPYLDRVILRFNADQNQHVNALLAGQAQLTGVPVARVAEVEGAGKDTLTYGGGGGVGVWLNSTVAPFNDLRVRQAVSWALDPEDYNEVISNGLGDTVYNMFPEESPFYDEDLDFPTGDPAKAKKLFDEVEAATGQPIRFTFFASDATRASGLVDWFLTQFEPYDNVEIKVEIAQSSEFIGRLFQKRYEASTFGILNLFDPDPQLYDALHSKGSRNYTGMNDSQTDRALEAARDTQDQDERVEQYAIVQERFNELIPFVLFSRTRPTLAFEPDVKDVELWSDGVILYDGIWIEQ